MADTKLSGRTKTGVAVHEMAQVSRDPHALPETLMSDTTRRVTVWTVHRDKKTHIAKEIPLADAAAAQKGAELVWVHYDLERGATLVPSDCPIAMPDMARDALTAFETRPRSEQIGNGAMLNLRGLGEVEQYNGDPLVSLRMWAERNVVVTASFRNLLAMGPVHDAMRQGRYQDAGDVIAALADAITEALDPKVADLGDRLDDIESVLETAQRPMAIRRRVSRVRQLAISYRRFIAPQRAALEKLQQMDLDWMDESDRIKIRASADRCARMAEELEAVRERAAVAHEELTDLRAEKIDGRSLFISIIAMIFLPLTFITGLLGMNVAGIPYAQHPHAFWWVTGGCLVLALLIMGWFSIRKWYQS